MRDLIPLTVNLLEASLVNSQQSSTSKRNKLEIRLTTLINSLTSGPGLGSLRQAHVKFSPGGERGLRGLIAVDNIEEEARAIGKEVIDTQTTKYGFNERKTPTNGKGLRFPFIEMFVKPINKWIPIMTPRHFSTDR
ncbi:hypothetical protein Tco_0661232 [Tanacetum coccineum]